MTLFAKTILFVQALLVPVSKPVVVTHHFLYTDNTMAIYVEHDGARAIVGYRYWPEQETLTIENVVWQTPKSSESTYQVWQFALATMRYANCGGHAPDNMFEQWLAEKMVNLRGHNFSPALCYREELPAQPAQPLFPRMEASVSPESPTA